MSKYFRTNPVIINQTTVHQEEEIIRKKVLGTFFGPDLYLIAFSLGIQLNDYFKDIGKFQSNLIYEEVMNILRKQHDH